MSRFEEFVDHVFQVEGGYVDHPEDRGGPTNLGITLATLAAWRKAPVSKEDVKNLTKQEAAKIYKTNYYDKVGGDQIIDEKVSLILFDQAVNRGTGSIVKDAQMIAGSSVDGVMGPKTIAAINGWPFMKSALMAKVYSKYADIVYANPSQVVFLRGWVNRANTLLRRVYPS